MAGSDRNATTKLAVAGSEINFFRAALANIKDIHPRLAQPLYQRHFDGLAAQANIVTDHHRIGLNNVCVGATDAVGHIFI